MRNKWRISHLEYLHVDLRRLAFRTLFEAVTDAFTKESEQQVDSTMALTICENKVTFGERSYAHCSMCIYMHPRTFVVCDTMGASPMQLPFLPALRSDFCDIGYTNALDYRPPFLHCSGGAGGFSVYIRSGSIAGGTPHSSGHRTITAWQAARHLAA